VVPEGFTGLNMCPSPTPAVERGPPGVAPHDLRTTCAKLCRADGGELEQIQLLWATLLSKRLSGILGLSKI
jgi:hypothetical protein